MSNWSIADVAFVALAVCQITMLVIAACIAIVEWKGGGEDG